MARSRSNNPSPIHRLVYSTEQPVDRPRSGDSKKGSGASRRGPLDDVVRVWRETKGRKGKGVTVIKGLGLAPDELSKLAGELKKKCGSGGTAKQGVIEIQGNHSDTVIEELRQRGWKVKKAGG